MLTAAASILLLLSDLRELALVGWRSQQVIQRMIPAPLFVLAIDLPVIFLTFNIAFSFIVLSIRLASPFLLLLARLLASFLLFTSVLQLLVLVNLLPVPSRPPGIANALRRLVLQPARVRTCTSFSSVCLPWLALRVRFGLAAALCQREINF